MGRRHVEDYYNQITQDYTDMLDSLKDMQEAVETKMLSPDKLEQMQKQVDALKENYMRISYIMFLLNKPNKKEKEKKYNRQFAKKLDSLKGNTLSDIKEEDREIIDKIRKII